MVFDLLGRKITISEGCKNYMKIVADFTLMADRAVSKFDSDTANMLLEVHNENELNHYYEKYITDTRRYIAQFGCYTLSDDEILAQITKNHDGKTELQVEFDEMVRNVIINTPSFESELDERYHQVKKMSEIINAGHFNISIRIDIMAMCDFVWQYLSENNLCPIQFVYKNKAAEAKTIYRNLVDDIVPAPKSMEFAASLIELDFSERNYYVLIFNKFPQARFEVAAIANFLGIDLSDLIEKEIKREFNLKSISSEDDALKMMEDLKLSMEKFCVTSSSRKRELEKILCDFDIKARTYDGILYDTRELCSQAEKDDEALFKLHGAVESIDKASCSRFLTEIVHAQCTAAVKNKHLQLLNDRITAIDNEYLKNLLSAVEASDEAECNRLEDVINQYDAPEETKSPYIARVEKRIYTIWDMEDFERFTEIYTQTQVSSSEQVGKNIVLIRESGRTEIKERFIKALYLLNENEVMAAAKYAVAKESGLLASLVNMGKKETYEILTLNGRVMHPAILCAMEEAKAKKSNGIFANLGFGKNKIKQQTQPQASAAKFCSSCGSPVDGASRFCSKCGNKLN